MNGEVNGKKELHITVFVIEANTVVSEMEVKYIYDWERKMMNCSEKVTRIGQTATRILEYPCASLSYTQFKQIISL